MSLPSISPLISIRLHDAHQTHKADLGQIDQAIWNTSQGRFVQEIKGEAARAAVSPTTSSRSYAPVSLVFWLWDDVRALLVLQALAVALGAWPVFQIAWLRLGLHWGKEQGAGRAGQPASRAASYQALASLAFVVAYLLYPPLQATLVADFHALPLATPLHPVGLSVQRAPAVGTLCRWPRCWWPRCRRAWRC